MTQNALATIDPNVLGGTGLAAWLESFKPNVYSNHRGAARPDYAVAGMIWAKSISSAAEEIYYYDGAGDILLGTFNPTDHTLLAKLLKSLDAGATFGPDLLLDRASPSPQANDILGAVRWGMRNASAAQVIAAMDTAEILDTTAGSEDARRLFQSIVAGTLDTRMMLGAGLYMPGATGGDPGAGKINAAGLQINGVDLFGSAGLIGIQIFTASGTYSKNLAASYIISEILGASGGAGGAAGVASGHGHGQSGAGAGYSFKKIAAVALSGSETVTIGAKGAGGVGASGGGTNGGDGGTTSFGAHHSVTGAKGGNAMAGPYLKTSGYQCLGGIGVGGDINLRGDPGQAGISYSGSNHNLGMQPGGKGAGPIAGPRSLPPYRASGDAIPVNGTNADANSGSGGSNGSTAYNSATSYCNGGDGSDGLIIIKEYA